MTDMDRATAATPLASSPGMERAPVQAQMSAPTADIGDDHMSSGIYNTCADNMGWCVACCQLPLACCGGGPMITIKMGHVGLVTKFGKFDRVMPPGRYAYNVMSEEIRPVNMKTICLDVTPQSVMTKDNLSVSVNAVCYFKVIDACKAVFAVDNYTFALNNLAQVTLRTVLGEHDLQEVFGQRGRINSRITELVDHDTDKWGIKVISMEMKDVAIPESMQRAMATVAESNQEATAKIIAAKAQRDCAEILADAASQMGTDPAALQLQWFDTLQKIAAEKHSTIVVPDSILGLMSRMQGQASGSSG